MHLVKDQSFKVTWRIEDFGLWAFGDTEIMQWRRTPMAPVEALVNAVWLFELIPSTFKQTVAISLSMVGESAALQSITIEYKICTLRTNGLPILVTGTLVDMKPERVYSVDIMSSTEVLEHLQDDRFTIACEIWQKKQLEQVDFSKMKWEDDIQRLSDDMRKLLESGYMSDLSLLTDDDRKIPVHASVLYARWLDFRRDLTKFGFTNRIAVHDVSGSTLAAFMSYLYTGNLAGPKITLELHDFAVRNDIPKRKVFHSWNSEIYTLTKQKKEHLTFTWHVNDASMDSMPLFWILPVQEVDGDEIVVTFNTEEDPKHGELYLTVSFQAFVIPCRDWICLHCTGNLQVGGGSLKSCSTEQRLRFGEEWKFPNFIPMRLLTNSEKPGHRTVQFELVISNKPQNSFIERSVTEFHTGSRDIKRMEWLGSDFCEFFMRQPCNLYDVTLKSKSGCFFSCKVFLGARSKTFRRFFRKYRKDQLILDLTEINSLALANVLQYIYTGCTTLENIHLVQSMRKFAVKLSLAGLVEKCERFINEDGSISIRSGEVSVRI